VSPRLVIADGALGFWKAASEVWPTTREQRCWVHKTANVLAKLPKSQQPKAKRALQRSGWPETKAVAELAFDAFIESYTPKYEKAADCLGKDPSIGSCGDARLRRCFNRVGRAQVFPVLGGEIVESQECVAGCLSNKTALAMVFKLVEGAQESWRRLDGRNQLPKLVLGVTFNDGIEVIAKPTDRQPKTAAA
jgi:putative transposase